GDHVRGGGAEPLAREHRAQRVVRGELLLDARLRLGRVAVFFGRRGERDLDGGRRRGGLRAHRDRFGRRSERDLDGRRGGGGGGGGALALGLRGRLGRR